jgi:hypothetical protein
MSTLDPSMFGIGGGPGMGPDPGMAGPVPGAGQSPTDQMAMEALGGLTPKSPNPTTSVQKIEQALDMAHKLMMALIPQFTQMNAKLAKDAHQCARTILSMKTDLKKDVSPGAPPDMMAGFGLAGTPGPLGPTAGGQPGV